MPTFMKAKFASPRFPKDFQVVPLGNYQPTNSEQAYLDFVGSLIDDIAASIVADASEGYPEDLATGRAQVRTVAIASIEKDVDQFVGGQNPSADQSGAKTIRDTYEVTLPKFGTIPSAPPLYEGDFNVAMASGYAPGPDERMFLACVKAATDEFKTDKANDGRGGYSSGVMEARGRQREAAARDLQARIGAYWSQTATPASAAEGVMLARGQYQAKRDRLTKRLFNVTVEQSFTDGKRDTILDIKLAGGLPPPQDIPSTEKQELFVQINKALCVVRTVSDRIIDRSDRGLRAWLRVPDEQAKKHAEMLQEEFVQKLGEVAKIGLELDFTTLAKRMLDEARSDFFVREAGRIKNMYVKRLGVWSAAAGSVFLIAYIMLYKQHLAWDWGHTHKSFLLAACGAAIGTWASFSIRQVQFSFDDLVMVEESSLEPPMRILFVIVLTMAACLLFWTGALNIEVGHLRTQSDSFKAAGSTALLIGLFCGLSERALATAIAGRAAAFVKTVGGS